MYKYDVPCDNFCLKIVICQRGMHDDGKKRNKITKTKKQEKRVKKIKVVCLRFVNLKEMKIKNNFLCDVILKKLASSDGNIALRGGKKSKGK
jgi:hypothetical protein